MHTPPLHISAARYIHSQHACHLWRLQLASSTLTPPCPLLLPQTVSSMRLQVTQGQQHYTEVKERNKAELARLQLERYSDFKSAMGAFAQVQSQLMSASADIWASAAQLFAESQQRDKDRQEQ